MIPPGSGEIGVRDQIRQFAHLVPGVVRKRLQGAFAGRAPVADLLALQTQTLQPGCQLTHSLLFGVPFAFCGTP
jgi:hypothetical protein